MKPHDTHAAAAAALLQSGRTQAARGDFHGACDSFTQATRLAPDIFDAWFLLGIVHMRNTRHAEALPALQQAHRLQPGHVDALRALADATFHAGTPADALPLWQQVVAARPEDLEARLRLGETCNRLGLFDAETRLYLEALEKAPAQPDLWLALAQCHEDAGDKTAAIDAYTQALQYRPGWATALAGLLSLQRKDAPEALLARASALMEQPATQDRERALLGYALGKIHDGRGEAKAAMTHWRAANAARQRLAGAHDFAATERNVDHLIAAFGTGAFNHQRVGSHDARPVFVVGMPRSGTTLTEQIIAAHPQAHGCGELPDIALMIKKFGSNWPTDAAALTSAQLEPLAKDYLLSATRNAPPDALRLIDKAPLNFYNLGLIAWLFPNARVIWCRRDPRDIALSIYGENFAFEAQFATDLDAIAQVIALQTRLMHHWQSVLPLPIHTLDYEALVQAPEDQARRLLEYLGLPWDPGCLQFHRNQRAVQTPSRWQVREPIHAKAAGRWQRYADSLPNFLPMTYPETVVAAGIST